MGSNPSTIGIHFNCTPPFVAGQQVTGTVTLNNKLNKSIKCKRIYAEFVGKVIHTTKQYYAHAYHYTTHHEPFFQQLINLEEKEEQFALTSDYYSWPINFSLPAFLPPSLDQLFDYGPYVRYKIRVIFERSEDNWNDICLRQDFPILIIASPSSCPQTSYLPTEAENKNRSDVTLHAALINRNGSFAPGDNFLLNIELHNPNHKRIKGLSIDLVQHRNIAMGKHCEQTIPLVDLSHLREFSGESYCEALQLTIPDDDRIIPSFYYMLPTFSEKPIVVEYVLKLKVKIHGFFKDFILNIPIVLRSMEMYIPPLDEQEAPSPHYHVAIAKH